MLLDLVHLRLVEPALGIGRQAVGRRVEASISVIARTPGLGRVGDKPDQDRAAVFGGFRSPNYEENADPAQILSKDVRN